MGPQEGIRESHHEGHHLGAAVQQPSVGSCAPRIGPELNGWKSLGPDLHGRESLGLGLNGRESFGAAMGGGHLIGAAVGSEVPRIGSDRKPPVVPRLCPEKSIPRVGRKPQGWVPKKEFGNHITIMDRRTCCSSLLDKMDHTGWTGLE